MTEFYRNLWKEKMTKLEALRQAQLWMLRKQPDQAGTDTRGRIKTKDLGVASSERLPAFYWAAFVLSGDWQ